MAIKTYGSMAVDWETTDQLRPAAQRTSGQGKGRAEEVGDGRAAGLRHEQRAVSDGDDDRHLGRRTRSAGLRCCLKRRADHVGFRFGGEASSAELPVDGGTLAGRYLNAARRDVARDGPGRKRGAQDQDRARDARPAQTAAGHRRGRAAGAVCAAEGGHHGRRRATAHVRRTRDQDGRRDLAAQPLRHDGRRRV